MSEVNFWKVKLEGGPCHDKVVSVNPGSREVFVGMFPPFVISDKTSDYCRPNPIYRYTIVNEEYAQYAGNS